MNGHCLLLSCGPSLDKVPTDQLAEFAEGKTVYAVKLAYFKLPHEVDTLFINCCNNPKPKKGGQFYSFEERRFPPTVVASSNFARWVRLKGQRIDHFFRVPNTSRDPHEVVADTRNFDKFLLSKTTDRPVGPGIMLETVLYWIVNQGFTELTTLGWDLSENSIHRKNYQHCEGWDRTQFSVPGYILPTDAKKVVNASEDIYKWLASHNVNWQILDPYGDCALWQGIPRIKDY